MFDSKKTDGVPAAAAAAAVKTASRDTETTAAPCSKVPFHIPTIPRPQNVFNIRVDNSERPFEHVWLERSEDGGRFVHPLEKLSVLDFVDRNVGEGDPVKPLPIETTPFKLVEGVKELKELAAKLRDAKEFAVDLEHNRYRSFQGLTCLMQISTRTEDFIIDTLKLRVHIGPYLREVFKDPAKRKVMHGAACDILWLQRDFSIYVCNLFDTGQASQVMQLERHSLEYILHHFCGVNANKEYQNADWRLRPLPEKMLKYAREDTHYLLHIYDLMRNKLLCSSSSGNDFLLQVYKHSYEVCMQLYEKEILTDTSYLHTYGLQEADFNSKQLAVVSGLFAWRDKVAREEDESTGYILPNKALLEIARQMPLPYGKLCQLLKSKHPNLKRHFHSVIGFIWSSVGNSSSFESISEQLKKRHHELSTQQNIRDGINNGSNMHSAELVTASMADATPTTTEVFSSGIALDRRFQQEEKALPLSEIGCSFKLSNEKMDDGITESLGSAKQARQQMELSCQYQLVESLASFFGLSSQERNANMVGGD